jgi:hypothetical protein
MSVSQLISAREDNIPGSSSLTYPTQRREEVRMAKKAPVEKKEEKKKPAAKRKAKKPAKVKLSPWTGTVTRSETGAVTLTLS